MPTFKVRCWNEAEESEYVIEREAPTIDAAIELAKDQKHKVRANQKGVVSTANRSARPSSKPAAGPAIWMLIVSFLFPIVGVAIGLVRILTDKPGASKCFASAALGMLLWLFLYLIF